jgi:peroxiredoxin
VPLVDPGTRLPAIELQDAKGLPVSPPSRIEILYGFFKTTCPTCALAWPYLERIGKLAERSTFSILAVSQDDPETTVRFYADLGVEIPTLYDPEPWRASDALGVTSVPTFLLVDKDGVVSDTTIGFQRHKMEEYGGLATRLAGRSTQVLFSPSENVPPFRPG